MRLDFNILWVEDQPTKVNSQRESIERKMRNEGFKLQTEFVSSVEDVEKHLGDSVFRDHVDLVLMDYELAGAANGGDGLEVVREKCPFKDIVFYSAKVPTELKKIVADNEISGVFCTHRNDLPDTVLGVFGVLVKKVLDIDHSRGIVMGATSEIDDFIVRAIEAVYLRCDEAGKARFLDIIKADIGKIRATFEEDCMKLEALTDIAELKSCHRVYSSIKRLILLRKILKETGRKDVDLAALVEYEQTSSKRNILAHVTVARNGFSRRIFDNKGNELTIEVMRELRVELLRHHELFEDILHLLSAEDSGSSE